MTRDLSRLLRPASIAVYGSGWAENVIKTCRRIGYEGEIWPIHPGKDSIAGQRAYPSIDATPHPPDAVFLGVNRDLTLSLMPDIARSGAGGVIVFASGFAEREDRESQALLTAAAGEMPILGPNCYGVINALDGAAVWPDEQGLKRVGRGVGIISQSSNIAMTLTMCRTGVPIGMVACVGNAAQTSMVDLGRAMIEDERVTALGLYIEGIPNARGLAELAMLARQKGKGIVALKSGRSPASRAAAQSHTASLAGDARVSSALLARCGIGEVENLPGLLETLKILHASGPLTSPRVVSVSCSGGEAGLVADAAIARGLELPALTDAGRSALAQALGPGIALANPLDYQTFVWGDAERMAKVFTAAMTDMDAGLFIIDPPRADRCDPSGFDPAFAAMTQTAKSTGKRVFAVQTLPGSITEKQSEELAGKGVIALSGIEEALSGLRAAAAPFRDDGWRPWPAAEVDVDTVLVDEAAAKGMLSEAGITVPRGTTSSELDRLDISDLTRPLVLKALGIPHKTEGGAVRLGLTSLDGVSEIEGATGYLAEEMLTAPFIEVLVGLRRDPVCGVSLTIGAGGVLAELIDDVATLICPFDAVELRAALSGTKIHNLLAGHRGREPSALESLIEGILRLQGMIAKDRDLIEIEINPMAVTPTQAVALDALMRRRKT